MYAFDASATRDAHGRLLDANGVIIGSIRDWTREDRAAHVAAVQACLDALDARRAPPRDVGTNSFVTLQRIAQASHDPAVVLWIGKAMEARGAAGAEALYRARAMRLAKAQADAIVVTCMAARAARKAARSRQGNEESHAEE